MSTQSQFYVFIDKSVYKGEYSDIKQELKDVFIKTGTNLGWKLKLTDEERIVFSTPFSLRSIGETVTVFYETYKISVVSVANQKTVVTTWGKNDDNCKKYLDTVLNNVKEYLNKKEINRQSENLEVINKVRSNIEPIETNKNLFKIISENQNKIEKSLIPNFIKVFQYYEEQVKIHNLIYENINDLNFHKLHTWSIEQSIESINVYSSTIKVLEITIEQLYTSYINEDLINFYTLFNKFEEMGLFMTKGEKLMIKGLGDINDNIDNLVVGIDKLTDQISDMGKTLDGINGNLRLSNFLSIINTYQLYRTNRNINKLMN